MNIITKLYYNYFKSKKKKNKIIYQKIDLLLLKYINIFGFWKYMLFASFICWFVFANKTIINDYYDNCIYN